MLILLGSSVNMMIKHSLAYSSPLYGRRSGHFEVKPFNYEASRGILEYNRFDSETSLTSPATKDFEKSFSLYSVLSGIPAYLRRADLNQSFEENIENLFFRNDSFLASEPELLLAEEFDQPTNFMTVLKAIGFNQTRYSEILNSTSLDTSQLPFYLKTLLKLQIIEKLAPITDKNPEITKNSRYVIKDKFLRFYFSFILPNISQIGAGGGQSLLVSKSSLLTQIIAKSYEEESLEFIFKGIREKKLPEIYKIGRWWNKNTEIDLVGLDETTNSIMFVETKWNNQKVDLRVLKDLQKKAVEVKWGDQVKPTKIKDFDPLETNPQNSMNFDPLEGVNNTLLASVKREDTPLAPLKTETNHRQEYFVLISKSGFTEEVLDVAKADDSLFLIEKDRVVEK